MSNIWQKASVVVGVVGVIIAIGHFVTPEVRCLLRLRSESCPAVSKQEPKASAPALTAPTPPITKPKVAIVADPPSNVRKSPNGNSLCLVREHTKINICGSTNGWYYTDICGTMGVIHSSQTTLQLN
jgi:hypothetical protein